jgi:hypothetical protein
VKELIPTAIFLAAYFSIPLYVLWRRVRRPIHCDGSSIPAGRRYCGCLGIAHYGKKCPNCGLKSDAQ